MKDWYCPLPFKHAYVDATGISTCCQTQRQDVTLLEWTNNPLLLELQQSMRDGVVHPECVSCAQSEEAYGTSLRVESVKDYDSKRFESTDIDYIDYRSSNLCNFKCRSCNSRFSHGIAQEARKHVELQEYNRWFEDRRLSVTLENKDWILQNLKGMKRLMLAGGEPTIMPEVKQIISQIIEQKLEDIHILITSNGSFTDDFWYELTKQHHNLHWTISIDAVGSAAELVRHGTDWDVVRENLRWMAINARSLNINTVISNLNLLVLKPVLELGREMQKLSADPNGNQGSLGCRHQFFISQRPYRLTADNWPDDIKPQVLLHLEECLKIDLDDEQRSIVQGLVHSIEKSVFDPELWQQSNRYNSILDRVRGENHLQLQQI